MGNVYVDVLTRRYLDLEIVLWKEIEQSNEDRNAILQKIHTEHLKFYSRPFIAPNSAAEAKNIFDKIFFGTEIFDADLKVATVKGTLQRPLDRSLDDKVIGMSRHCANTILLDRMYEISIGKEYFPYIKEVSLGVII